MIRAWVVALGCMVAGFAHANGSVLKIELSPALCDLEEHRQQLKSCIDGFSISVSSLTFNSAPRGRCSGNPVELSPLQTKLIARVMPDESVREDAWQLNGACAEVSEKDYFRMIVERSSKLKVPKELASGRSYLVNKDRFLREVLRLNPGMPVQGVEMVCRKNPSSGISVLTELQVCYDSASRFAACPVVSAQKCPDSFQVRGLGR